MSYTTYLFMVILGMVYCCFTHIIPKVWYLPSVGDISWPVVSLNPGGACPEAH
jgi:hypothetical protein